MARIAEPKTDHWPQANIVLSAIPDRRFAEETWRGRLLIDGGAYREIRTVPISRLTRADAIADAEKYMRNELFGVPLNWRRAGETDWRVFPPQGRPA